MGNVELQLYDPELKALFLAMTGAAGFNREGFLTLLEDTDEKTVLSILARFRETLANTVDAAANTKDGETLGKAFHKVAGSAELLGFNGLGILSRELDGLLRKKPDVDFYAGEIAKFGEVGRGVLRVIQSACPGLAKYIG